MDFIQALPCKFRPILTPYFDTGISNSSLLVHGSVCPRRPPILLQMHGCVARPALTGLNDRLFWSAYFGSDVLVLCQLRSASPPGDHYTSRSSSIAPRPRGIITRVAPPPPGFSILIDGPTACPNTFFVTQRFLYESNVCFLTRTCVVGHPNGNLETFRPSRKAWTRSQSRQSLRSRSFGPEIYKPGIGSLEECLNW